MGGLNHDPQAAGVNPRCRWCSRRADYRTPVGLLCAEHLDSVLEGDDPLSCYGWPKGAVKPIAEPKPDPET